MALTWDFTHVADETVWKDVTGPDGQWKLTPVADSAIWTCLAVGIGEITEKNADEWYARAHVWEKVFGAMRLTQQGDVLFTLAEVRSLVGLRTNVFPKVTNVAWIKNLLKSVAERAERRKEEAR